MSGESAAKKAPAAAKVGKPDEPYCDRAKAKAKAKAAVRVFRLRTSTSTRANSW